MATKQGKETSEPIKFNKGLPQGDALCPTIYDMPYHRGVATSTQSVCCIGGEDEKSRKRINEVQGEAVERKEMLSEAEEEGCFGPEHK